MDDSRVMPDLAVVCPDCGAEAGVECHPDCSTFWTEEESMNTERVSADVWIEEYVDICCECKSAECGAQNGRLLVRISKKQYETRENVCPRCDRIKTFCNCEDY